VTAGVGNNLTPAVVLYSRRDEKMSYLGSTDDIYAGAVIGEDTHTNMHDHFWCFRHVPSYTRAWPIIAEASFANCEKCDTTATLLTQDDENEV
jgi:hypothetical protein